MKVKYNNLTPILQRLTMNTVSARKYVKKVLVMTALFLFAAGVVKARAQTSFAITSPTSQEVVVGSSLTLTFSTPSYLTLTDYTIRPKSTYGQGHIHLWIDQDNPTPQNAIEVTSDSFTLNNLKYGPHTIQAELVTNAHTSLIPKTLSSVMFTTTQPQESVSPLSLPVFQMAVFAVILIIIALYFITYHIKPSLHKKSKKSR